MTVADKLRNSNKPLFSFELLPPLKGDHIQAIYGTIDPLLEFDPAYINVTYHREEVIYKELKNGTIEKRTIRKRPGTVGIAAAIKYKYKIDVIPHIICAGFDKEETENALIDLHFLEIDNILVLRGDPDKSTGKFIPEPNGHKYAIDLLKQIVNMNNGIYLDDDIKNITPTHFSTGVAGYPEKHPEAPNLDTDIMFLKQKIDEGAEYIVTQMFFDNTHYLNFVKKCREAGITVPIVPGIKPISNQSHLTQLPKTFYIDIPINLVKEVSKCKSNNEIRQVGIEWAIEQCKELIQNGVPSIHFYTMGMSDNIAEIAKNIY